MFTRSLRRAVIRAMLVTTVVGVLAVALPDPPSVITADVVPIPTEAPAPDHWVAVVTDAKRRGLECWQGDEPAPVPIPSHAAILPPDADHPRISARATGPALEHEVNGAPYRPTVLGFCTPSHR